MYVKSLWINLKFCEQSLVIEVIQYTALHAMQPQKRTVLKIYFVISDVHNILYSTLFSDHYWYKAIWTDSPPFQCLEKLKYGWRLRCSNPSGNDISLTGNNVSLSSNNISLSGNDISLSSNDILHKAQRNIAMIRTIDVPKYHAIYHLKKISFNFALAIFVEFRLLLLLVLNYFCTILYVTKFSQCIYWWNGCLHNVLLHLRFVCYIWGHYTGVPSFPDKRGILGKKPDKVCYLSQQINRKLQMIWGGPYLLTCCTFTYLQ